MTVDLSALGWDGGFAAAYAPFDHPDQQPARVTRVDKGVCTLLGTAGPLRASLSGALLAAGAADPTRLPCAGDWLVVRGWPDARTTAEAVLPRRTAIVRATAGAEAAGQVLAANVDAVAVVEPMEPCPDLGRIERLLSLAFQSGAQPLVVLSKVDLVPAPATVADQVASAAPGTPVLAVSAQTGYGLAGLRAFVTPGTTLGLLGPSGSGKSSLVNALAGATVMGTQELRADGRGRHTTTFRNLVLLPGGGAVLDTPGVRLVGLFDGSTGLDRAFADVAAFAVHCRFVDCGHLSEPGCAVLAAVEDGELPARRLVSWHKLRRELARQLARSGGRMSGDELRRWKREHRDTRRSARR